MTKQFGGNNPILHINFLWQICLKLQVTKTKAFVKQIVLTLKNLYKVEVKFTYLKITSALNYQYLNYLKTNCTVTTTKAEFCVLY